MENNINENNVIKKYVDFKGLSTYDRMLKDYLNKSYSNKYANDSDIENIFKNDDISAYSLEGESNDNGENIVQVKTLNKYNELLLSNLKYSVKEDKAIVQIGETEKELSTKDYVDSKFQWGYYLE